MSVRFVTFIAALTLVSATLAPLAEAQPSKQAREGLEGLAKKVVFTATSSIGGKIASRIDSLVLKPLIAYFTTGEDERLGAAFTELLKGGAGIYFPALGITLNAGKVVIGGSTYATLRLYEAAEERQVDQYVFGGASFDLLRDLRNPLRGQPSFFEVARKKFSITEQNIGARVKDEVQLRYLWNAYTSPLRGMPGPIYEDVERGWPALVSYWKIKRAEAIAQSLQALRQALETEAQARRRDLLAASTPTDISGTWWLRGGGMFEVQAKGTQVSWTLSIPLAKIKHQGHGALVDGVLSGTFSDIENPGGKHDGEYTNWTLSADGRQMCGKVRWWKQGDPTKKVNAGGGSDCYQRERPR